MLNASPRGVPSRTKAEKISGPTTKTSSKRVDSAAMATCRIPDRPLPALVSVVQAARRAGLIAGKAAPDRAPSAHSRISGIPARTAASRSSWRTA